MLVFPSRFSLERYSHNKQQQKLSHHHDNRNVLIRTSINIDLLNTNLIEEIWIFVLSIRAKNLSWIWSFWKNSNEDLCGWHTIPGDSKCACHPHKSSLEFFRNDQITPELFVCINKTNIYISFIKFILNGPILMELWSQFPLFCSNNYQRKMWNKQQP